MDAYQDSEETFPGLLSTPHEKERPCIQMRESISIQTKFLTSQAQLHQAGGQPPALLLLVLQGLTEPFLVDLLLFEQQLSQRRLLCHPDLQRRPVHRRKRARMYHPFQPVCKDQCSAILQTFQPLGRIFPSDPGPSGGRGGHASGRRKCSCAPGETGKPAARPFS